MAAQPPPPPPPPPHGPHGPSSMEDAGPRYILEPPPPEWHVLCLNILNTITQLAIGSVAFGVFFFMNLLNFAQPRSSFSLHIYLCVIGYIILMTEAVLSYNPHTGWSRNLKFSQKRIAHAILQIVGSVLAIAGSAIRIADMDSNFQTAHGICGLVAMLLTILSLIGGVVNLLFAQITNNVLIKTLHAVLGCVTLTLAYITLCLGFDGIFRVVAGDTNATLCMITAVFALVSTLLMTFISMSRRFSK